jgi:hypothetical protein
MIRAMCEQFVARAAEPFRLDELWPYAERVERYGIAGFGWGAGWLDADSGIRTYRHTHAFREDPARERIGAVETTSVLVHLRRPSRLSTLQLPDAQPFDDPAGRFAFSHNGDLRDYKAARRGTAGRAGSTAVRTARSGSAVEDAWSDDEPVAHLLAALHDGFGGDGELWPSWRGWHAVPLRGQHGEPGVHVPAGPDRARVHRDLLRGSLAVPVCGQGCHRPGARASPQHDRARCARASVDAGAGRRVGT